MNSRTIKALYLIETAFPLQQAAEIMAGEQSSGTFVKTPGETSDLKAKHAAQVEMIQEIEEVEQPALSGARRPSGSKIKRAFVELSWPLINIGLNLSQLMATVAGNLYELAPFSGLKLLDITIPEDFKVQYPGPKFGMTGTRKLIHVYDRPVIGTIIKPSVGLTPEATANQVRILIEAGLDFIKDDELMGDPPHSPFKKRVDEVMKVINAHADKTGKKPMYAFNISGDYDDMFRRHDYVVSQGGTCIMMNLNWVGLPAVSAMSKYTIIPIHGHRNFWGALYRGEVLGMEFKAFHKMYSMAGADHIHTNGIRNKFCESDESVITSVKACLNPQGGGYPVAPVISSGQWADQAYDTYQSVKSVDLLYLCGGGITGHPDGMAAGVKSIQLAWEAAVKGKKLDDIKDQNPEILHAIELFKK